MRRLGGLVLVLALLLPLTAGCGASAKADLGHALTEARAAVGGAILALELLERGRTTRAAALVTSGDMADQVALVQQRLAEVPADNAELVELRQRCQVVITDAMVALQDTEDALSGRGETAALMQDLTRVQDELDAAAAAVGSGG